MNAIGYAILVYVVSETILSVVQNWLNNGAAPNNSANVTRLAYSLLLALATLLIMWGK